MSYDCLHHPSFFLTQALFDSAQWPVCTITASIVCVLPGSSLLNWVSTTGTSIRLSMSPFHYHSQTSSDSALTNGMSIQLLTSSSSSNRPELPFVWSTVLCSGHTALPVIQSQGARGFWMWASACALCLPTIECLSISYRAKGWSPKSGGEHSMSEFGVKSKVWVPEEVKVELSAKLELLHPGMGNRGQVLEGLWTSKVDANWFVN